VIANGHFQAANAGAHFDLQHVSRISPTMGAVAPKAQWCSSTGKTSTAWANKKGKDWLVEDGPAPWKIVGRPAS